MLFAQISNAVYGLSRVVNKIYSINNITSVRASYCRRAICLTLAKLEPIALNAEVCHTAAEISFRIVYDSVGFWRAAGPSFIEKREFHQSRSLARGEFEALVVHSIVQYVYLSDNMTTYLVVVVRVGVIIGSVNISYRQFLEVIYR